MLQVIQSTPGGVTSRRGSPTPPQRSRSPTPQPPAKRGRGHGRGTGRRRLPSLSPTRRLSRRRGHGRGTGRRCLPSLSPTRQLSRSPSHRSHQRRSQENTQQNPTQDDHSADSPIVGSFQVPVNLNESSLSLFDTTPYNAISDPSVPATFKVVSSGTTKLKPRLVSSDGFSYSVKTAAYQHFMALHKAKSPMPVQGHSSTT